MNVMRRVTREDVHVNGVTCPWLISKFVDKGAEFIFVEVRRPPFNEILNRQLLNPLIIIK